MIGSRHTGRDGAARGYGVLAAAFAVVVQYGCGSDAAVPPDTNTMDPADRAPEQEPSDGVTGAGNHDEDAQPGRADAARPRPRVDASMANGGGATVRDGAPGSSSGDAPTTPDAGATPAMAADAGELDGAAPSPASSAILPAISDPAQPGPFGAMRVATAPGLSSHTLFIPAKLGENGVRHPIIVWTNGATGSTSFYENMLEHFASHGFFIVADKMSGTNHDPEIVSQKEGIEWVLAEAKRAESPYFGKIDPDRLGIAGHSLGSVGSFANTGHPAVKASIHWSGGLTGNPVGAEESWLQLIKAPAAFLCGGAEARALPRCSGDFDNAPKGVPIFYGTVDGVGHTDVFGEQNGGQWGRAGVAWWRYTLAGDASFKSWFSGDGCVLCTKPWSGKSKGF